MFESLKVFQISDALARYSGARQAEISRNVANADTPGYRAKDLSPFSEVIEGQSFPLRRTQQGHLDSGDFWQRIDAPDGMSPNGNTVSLEDQILKSVETRHSYDLALGVYASSLSILRSSLGGRG